jgi:hypothetical protein
MEGIKLNIMTQIFTVNTYSLNVVILLWEDPRKSIQALCVPIFQVIIKFKYCNTLIQLAHTQNKIYILMFFHLTV